MKESKRKYFYVELNDLAVSYGYAASLWDLAVSRRADRLTIWHPNPRLRGPMWQPLPTWPLALTSIALHAMKTMSREEIVAAAPRIGTGVTNPKSNSVEEIETHMRGINGLYPGVVLGSGRGDSALRPLGEKPATAKQTVLGALEVLRRCGEGEDSIDITAAVAVHGPAMLRALKEHDPEGKLEIILGTGFDDATLEFVSRTLGRPLKDIKIVINPAIFDPINTVDHLVAVAQISHHMVDSFKGDPDAEFIPEKYRAGISAVAARYPIGKHGRLTSRESRILVAAVKEQGHEWTSYMLNRYCLLGDTAVGRMVHLRELGVSGLSVPGFRDLEMANRCFDAIDAAERVLDQRRVLNLGTGEARLNVSSPSHFPRTFN